MPPGRSPPNCPPDSPARRELDAYLAVTADQPAGRMRIGQDLFNRGRGAEAEAALRKAVDWDPNSPGILDALGVVLNELGKTSGGRRRALARRAAQSDRRELGLQRRPCVRRRPQASDAEFALRETVRRNPRHDRAWYNLGLARAANRPHREAIAASQHAEQIAPNVADYPYARATILWQRGDREAAQAAARRTLEIDPAHAEANALVRQARN